MARLRSHGITRYPAEMTCQPDGSWFYQQIELGFNYRMTDIQAALGISQMRRLDEFVSQRHVIAKRYEELLHESDVTRPWQHPDTHSALHLYVVRLSAGALKANHREVFERMRTAGIGVNLHYIPVYRQPYYQNMGFNRESFPEAESYYAEAITLPIYPGLTPEQQSEVVNRLFTPSGHQTIF
jgi:dTDP-4-amino-4,6-dideoxygalactose transaminase